MKLLYSFGLIVNLFDPTKQGLILTILISMSTSYLYSKFEKNKSILTEN